MKLVELTDDTMPLLFKGNCTFYKKGERFEVVEEKELAVVGKCYKLKGYGVVFDGWQVAKYWKEVS